MFSPTRTALYLAIATISFGADEANAGCGVVGGTYMCASWIKGSEVCNVTLSPYHSLPLTAADVTCAIDGYDAVHNCLTDQPPTGTLTCGTAPPPDYAAINPGLAGPTGFAPSTPTDCAIFGVNSVTLSGGSTAAPTGSSNTTVCSNGTIRLSGNNTKVYGDAYSHGTVTTSGGAHVTGQTTSNAAALPVVPTVSDGSQSASDCGTSSTPLSRSGKQTITLSGDVSYNSVSLSGQSMIVLGGPTTLRVKNGFTSSGQSMVATNGYDLTLISCGTNVALGAVAGGGSMTVNAPSAAVALAGGTSFAGAVIGKTVDFSGGSTGNIGAVVTSAQLGNTGSTLYSDTVTATCTSGSCAASAEILPPPGSTCPNGNAAVDFTADAMFATVEGCYSNMDGPEGCVDLYQVCQLAGNTYRCTVVTSPPPYCGSGS